MCLILPAFSSPDLKAFPLCSKSSKSSAGGQGETVSSVSAFFHLSLRSSLQEAATPATDSPDTRFSIGVLVVLSECLCLWRKDPYLPYQPLSVRHLPRTTSLPPMAFVASFRLCPADAKTVPKHHRPTHFRPLVRHCRLDRHLPPEGMYLDYINSKGMHLTAIASRCFSHAGIVS